MRCSYQPVTKRAAKNSDVNVRGGSEGTHAAMRSNAHPRILPRKLRRSSDRHVHAVRTHCIVFRRARVSNHENDVMHFVRSVAKHASPLRACARRARRARLPVGVGENDAWLRDRIVRELAFCGIALDPSLHAARRDEGRIISASVFCVLAEHSREDAMLLHAARQTSCSAAGHATPEANSGRDRLQ